MLSVLDLMIKDTYAYLVNEFDEALGRLEVDRKVTFEGLDTDSDREFISEEGYPVAQNDIGASDAEKPEIRRAIWNIDPPPAPQDEGVHEDDSWAKPSSRPSKPKKDKKKTTKPHNDAGSFEWE